MWLFLGLLLLSPSAFCVGHSGNDKIIEELTGKAPVQAPPAAPLSISEKHLLAGRQAAQSKNYILALRHYNTVIVKRASAKEVAAAYRAKSDLYREMGLQDQAHLNLQLAEENQKSLR